MSPLKPLPFLLASSLVFSLSGLVHAGDSSNRGRIVALDQHQVEIQLGRDQVPHEGTVYRVMHYRGGPPKDPLANTTLYAGRVRVTRVMDDGRAHAEVLDGEPKVGDQLREEAASTSRQQ